MSARVTGLAATLALLVPAPGAWSGEADYALRHNPFSRPELGEVAAGGGAEPAGTAGEPELRATLVAGRGSLANVGGELLAVGDEIDGYRLVRVGEGFAEFERGKERTTIYIKAPTPKRTKGRR